MTTPLYGYNGSLADSYHIVRDAGTRSALCGLALEYIPNHQPVIPAVCWRCEVAARTQPYATPDVDEPEHADDVCPSCGWAVGLDADGHVLPHQERRVAREGVYPTGKQCVGAGKIPEAAS